MSLVLIKSLKNESKILLDDNPLAVPRLKRRTILEFLTQRIDQLEEEVAKEKEFVKWNKNKDDNRK
jgi:hypothetical protein